MDLSQSDRLDNIEDEATEEALSGIADGSPVASFVINRQHRVIHWNTAIEALTSIKKQDIIGTDEHRKAFYGKDKQVLADLIVDGASDQEIENRYGKKSQKSRIIEGAYEVEDYFPVPPGNTGKWLRFTASPIRNRHNRIIGAIETMEDITERKTAEAALKRMFENQSYYLKEITRAQEEERKRIARELHDSTAQNLIALLHQIENLLDDEARFPVSHAKSIWVIYERVRDILLEVRRFSRDLRPSILDDLGLIPALEWLTADFNTNYGIEIALTRTGKERRLFPEAELNFFRIVQESLTNVIKHACASRIDVSLEFTEKNFSIQVRDNGIGFFPPQNVGRLIHVGKLGLAGMAERVQLMNGTLTIDSRPGQGTSIQVQAPM